MSISVYKRIQTGFKVTLNEPEIITTGYYIRDKIHFTYCFRLLPILKLCKARTVQKLFRVHGYFTKFCIINDIHNTFDLF